MADNKLGIELYLESFETLLMMDTEKIDENLIIFGFGEHVFEEDTQRVFKTEQVLDLEELKMIKALIDKTIDNLGDDES